MFFFFNDTATTEIYTLSLHDALPICDAGDRLTASLGESPAGVQLAVEHRDGVCANDRPRSEEHTSELQSQSTISYAVFCLKKKNTPPNLPEQQHYL